MTQYVALLRGINVGGNNSIKMADLKHCFEDLGFDNVMTYIQSGNVLFDSNEASEELLRVRLEGALPRRFDYDAKIVLRSHEQLRSIVSDAPDEFGRQPDQYRYDVVFLRRPLTADEALREVKTREGVDRVFPGDGVCYFSRLISRATQSYLSRLIGMPVYQNMSIRNWNTTTRLLALMEARAKG